MESMELADRIRAGMDVCDANGEKFGTVNHIYRHAAVAAGAPADAAASDDVFSVKTGPFGLGKHLYIPFSAVQDVTEACVFVDRPKDALEGLGWDVKPVNAATEE